MAWVSLYGATGPQLTLEVKAPARETESLISQGGDNAL